MEGTNVEGAEPVCFNNNSIAICDNTFGATVGAVSAVEVRVNYLQFMEKVPRNDCWMDRKQNPELVVPTEQFENLQTESQARCVASLCFKTMAQQKKCAMHDNAKQRHRDF
ncbi:hypothetical protein NDU88_010731 [Pleurodeles waltl]|uniref:Uncharacterized protein n=1 Tax=Pleurodeles waltl TaxID=8319 RepID=A0AAV7QV78_PLEWA|nr:hypothetical protein NDU88_010731 [Pleurodeles waltl]